MNHLQQIIVFRDTCTLGSRILSRKYKLSKYKSASFTVCLVWSVCVTWLKVQVPDSWQLLNYISCLLLEIFNIYIHVRETIYYVDHSLGGYYDRRRSRMLIEEDVVCGSLLLVWKLPQKNQDRRMEWQILRSAPENGKWQTLWYCNCNSRGRNLWHIRIRGSDTNLSG